MLDTELFALLEHTADGAYSVTADGEICSWNGAAERLFGYSASEVLNRNIDDVFEARDGLGTDALSGGLESAARQLDDASRGIANFDLEVRRKDGERLWINVSTIVSDNTRTGRRLFVRIVHDITHRKDKEELLQRMAVFARQMAALTDDATDQAPVESLSEQELRILRLFADGANPAGIARKLNISAQTLRNHLHHINRKLRTHNRLEAVTHAQRRGLLD
jgi:PAS domain S-box-containing protein